MLQEAPTAGKQENSHTRSNKVSKAEVVSSEVADEMLVIFRIETLLQKTMRWRRCDGGARRTELAVIEKVEIRESIEARRQSTAEHAKKGVTTEADNDNEGSDETPLPAKSRYRYMLPKKRPSCVWW